MVIHDREQEQKWAQEQQAYTDKKPKNKLTRRWSLLAVQSLICTAIVLVALLFRIAGGTAYTRLQQGFSDALAENELMAVFMRWWDGDPAEMEWEEDVKGETFSPNNPGDAKG